MLDADRHHGHAQDDQLQILKCVVPLVRSLFETSKPVVQWEALLKPS